MKTHLPSNWPPFGLGVPFLLKERAGRWEQELNRELNAIVTVRTYIDNKGNEYIHREVYVPRI
jgi:hypothetical protein